MLRRPLHALPALTLLAAFGVATPALGAAVTLQPSQAAPGATVTLRGAGFPARASVSLHVAGRRLPVLRTGRAGAFATRVAVPAGRPRTAPVVSRVGAVRTVNLLTVRPRGTGGLGAQVATSRGSRVRVVSTETAAQGPVTLRVRRGPRTAAPAAWFPGGRPVALTARIATLAAPAAPRRARLALRVDGTTAYVWIAIASRPAPTPPAPAPPQPLAAVPPPAADAGPPAPPRLVAVGDVACQPGATTTATACRHAQVAALVGTLAPDAVAVLGDVQYEEGTLAEFQGSFHPTWGTPLGSLLRPVPGNHEYQDGNGAAGYFGYFGATAGDPAKGYYAFDLGGWRVLALNTNSNCTTLACGAGSAQEQWLRAELAASAARCTAAYWHHPRFSSTPLIGRSNAAMDGLWDAAHDGGADVVLAGHAHNYERFAPLDANGAVAAGGLREFVVGSGGKSLHPFDATTVTGSEVRIDDAFGVLELTLRDGAYDWRFVAEDGSVRDAGTQSCR